MSGTSLDLTAGVVSGTALTGNRLVAGMLSRRLGTSHEQRYGI